MKSVLAIGIGLVAGALVGWTIACGFAGQPVRGDIAELVRPFKLASAVCGAIGGGATAWAVRWKHRGAAFTSAALTSVALAAIGFIIFLIRCTAD